MLKKSGRSTFFLENTPSVVGWASIVGEKEGKGPLGSCFDKVEEDSHFGKDDLSAFGDAEEVADWALGFVQNLAAQGMLEGFGESLKPAVPITRAEVAKIIFECW